MEEDDTIREPRSQQWLPTDVETGEASGTFSRLNRSVSLDEDGRLACERRAPREGICWVHGALRAPAPALVPTLSWSLPLKALNPLVFANSIHNIRNTYNTQRA